MTKRVGLQEIKVGDRARTDLGDLTDLMTSIKEVGLLQPVVVTEDLGLIAGGRRLEACRRLGLHEVEVVVAEHISDAVDLLKAERDENTCRKDMTVSEKLAIAARIEEMKRPEAAARKADGGELGRASRYGGLASSSGGGSQKRDRNQETAALAADAVGMGRSTYYALRGVKKYADDPTQPAVIREAATTALADMDATGQFTPAYKEFVATVDSLRKRPRKDPKPEQPPVAPPLKNSYGRRYPQRSQHKALSEGMATLTGLCTGLARADLDDSVTAEEAAQWLRDLSSEVLPVLRQLTKKLKEHSNATR